MVFHSPDTSIVRLLLPVVLLALFAGTGHAANITTSCIAEQERLAQLQEHAVALTATRDALQDLREGKVDAKLPLSRLFRVELSQEDVVQRRVRELEASMKVAPDDAQADTGCAALRDAFADVLARLRSLEADVTVMRLAFLQLPATQREQTALLYALAARAEVLQRDLGGMTGAPPADWPSRHARLAQLRADIAGLLQLTQRPPEVAVHGDIIAVWRRLSDQPLLPPGHRLFTRETASSSEGATAHSLGEIDYRLTFLQVAALREAVRLRADAAFATRGSRWHDDPVSLGRDTWRELRDIPVFLLLPLLSTGAALARDADGWRTLADALVEGLVFIVAVWLAIRLARRSPMLMARLHDHIVARVTGRSGLDWLGALLRVSSPFAPWLIAWLAIDIILRVATIDSGIVALWFAPLARFYILFHLLRLALEGLREWLPAQGPRGATPARAGARAMTLLFFLAWLAHTHAGDALLAQLLQTLAWSASWLMLAWHFRHAGDDVLAQAGGHLDALGFNRTWASRLSPLPALPGGWLTIPALVCLLLFLALVHLAHEQLLHLDTYRRLVLRSMRLRMAAEGENSPADDAPAPSVPEDYLARFAQEYHGGTELAVQVAQREALRTAIDDWLRDHHDENALALLGDPGMGKSRILDELASVFNGRLRCRRLQHDARITDAAGLLAALAAALDETLPDGLDSLVVNDAARPPTLLLIDEAQRLFLARVGGLDAWRALLAAVNLPLQNLYWCVGIDTQSWLYLADVFGGRYQFPRVVRLRAWRQDDIRALILQRHGQGHYALRYEDVLLRARHLEDTGSLQSVEQRFFGLLWDSARGNPALALALWRESIHLAPGRAIVARTPPAPVFSAQAFSDTGLFVLTAIVRHGALTTDDIVAVSDLPLAAVRHALKTGLDQGVVSAEQGHYRISLDVYHPLVAHLTGKNLLHE